MILDSIAKRTMVTVPMNPSKLGVRRRRRDKGDRSGRVYQKRDRTKEVWATMIRSNISLDQIVVVKDVALWMYRDYVAQVKLSKCFHNQA